MMPASCWFNAVMASFLAPPRFRLLPLLVALSLVGAACGGGGDAVAGQNDTLPVISPDQASELADPVIPGAEPPARAEPPATAEESTTPAAGPVAPVVNLFPDVDVLNVLNSDTVNIADELGGTGKPTLLWFWGPL